MNSVPIVGSGLTRDSRVAEMMVKAYGPKVILNLGLERSKNMRYFTGSFVTTSGRIIESWVDEYLCAELLAQRPSVTLTSTTERPRLPQELP